MNLMKIHHLRDIHQIDRKRWTRIAVGPHFDLQETFAQHAIIPVHSMPPASLGENEIPLLNQS